MEALDKIITKPQDKLIREILNTTLGITLIFLMYLLLDNRLQLAVSKAVENLLPYKCKTCFREQAHKVRETPKFTCFVCGVGACFNCYGP